MTKRINYYYMTLNDNGNNSYVCLSDTDTVITYKSELDFRNCKNFIMNSNYIESETELFRYSVLVPSVVSTAVSPV